MLQFFFKILDCSLPDLNSIQPQITAMENLNSKTFTEDTFDTYISSYKSIIDIVKVIFYTENKIPLTKEQQ